MELAGEWGLALSLEPRVPEPPEPPPPAGVSRRRTRLTEILRPGGFDDARCATELVALADLRAQLDAYQLAVVKRLAELRPDLWDLTPDDPGGRVEGWVPARTFAGVTEFFADELALILNCTRTRAHNLANCALVLLEQLPATWEALADGRIDLTRAAALVKVLGWQHEHVDPAVVAAVEREALGWAIAGETPHKLGERTAAALIALDAAAADRRRKQATRNSDVTVRGGRDGMSELVIDLPGPVAAACWTSCDTYARMWKADGDPRPIGQLRALVAADLILRPWDTSRPPVTAHLTVLAPLSALGEAQTAAGPGAPAAGADDRVEECGTVDGRPITAAQLRELLSQVDALCPGGLQAPTGGSLHLALADPGTGQLRATLTSPELERLTRRGCPTHPSSAAAGDCGCPVLDRPPKVDRYTPTPAQRRWVRTRDRGCRYPGCRRPAAWADLDHVVAHADGGETDCANLCCCCRRHHRIKTHAPGWRYTMTSDGILTVTTPSGVTRSTRPPGMGHGIPDDDLLVPLGGPPPDDLTPPRPAADDDPPPF